MPAGAGLGVDVGGELLSFLGGEGAGRVLGHGRADEARRAVTLRATAAVT